MTLVFLPSHHGPREPEAQSPLWSHFLLLPCPWSPLSRPPHPPGALPRPQVLPSGPPVFVKHLPDYEAILTNPAMCLPTSALINLESAP